MSKMPLEIILDAHAGKIRSVAIAQSHKFSWCMTGDTSKSLEKDVERWMTSYAEGRENPPLPPLDWDLIPSFTKKVLLALTTIPFGKTVSYQGLARSLG